MLSRATVQTLIEECEKDLEGFHRGELRVTQRFDGQPVWEDVTDVWIQRTERRLHALRGVLGDLPEASP